MTVISVEYIDRKRPGWKPEDLDPLEAVKITVSNELMGESESVTLDRANAEQVERMLGLLVRNPK